jgi:hypothetical protein
MPRSQMGGALLSLGAAKVSWITLSMGAVQAESWTAIPYGKFLDLVEGL